MMKNKEKQGFTLVEMMIVVAVLVTVAVIATPNLQTYMAQRRVSGAARLVMTDLMEARMKAAAENNRFKISFVDNHQYKVLDDDDNDNTEDAGETITITDIQNAYHDVTLSATTTGLIFNPTGTVDGTGTTVTLSNSSGSKEVRVSTAGRVKIK